MIEKLGFEIEQLGAPTGSLHPVTTDPSPEASLV